MFYILKADYTDEIIGFGFTEEISEHMTEISYEEYSKINIDYVQKYIDNKIITLEIKDKEKTQKEVIVETSNKADLILSAQENLSSKVSISQEDGFLIMEMLLNIQNALASQQA